MYCTNCGKEATAGQRFCVQCGSPLPQAAAAPAPAPPQAEVAAAQQQPAPPPAPGPRRRLGCLGWFFVVLLTLAVVAGGAVLWLAARLGLFEARLPFTATPAEAIARGHSDPAAAAAVAKAFQDGGVAGAQAAVVPLPASGAAAGNAAIVVIEPEKGFQPARGVAGKRQQAMAVMQRLVAANSEQKLNIRRISLHYREGGRERLALTAPMSTMADLVAGRIRERQFMASIDASLKDARFFIDLARARWGSRFRLF